MKFPSTLINAHSKNKKAAVALSKDQKKQRFESELIMMKILNALNVEYEWQKPFYNTFKFCVVDFYIVSAKIVIEVDGSNHKKKKDDKRSSWLYTMGVNKVYRVSNSELKRNPDKVLMSVKNVIHYQLLQTS